MITLIQYIDISSKIYLKTREEFDISYYIPNDYIMQWMFQNCYRTDLRFEKVRGSIPGGIDRKKKFGDKPRISVTYRGDYRSAQHPLSRYGPAA